MRVRNHLRILATVATLSAAGAPAASAFDIGEGAGGNPSTTDHAVAAVSHRPGSTDWELIALAGAGTVALLGPGLAARNRRVRGRRPSHGEAPVHRSS